ncbi:MAG: hypothetical protein MUD03_13495 [Pirellula sp.]|jgi:hypothetical protein|nr:hypothetical protein [Pirellula sp.]
MSLERQPTLDAASPVEKAIELAVRFHRGQRDKGGEAYILHPLRMMLQTEDPLVQQAAVLHDVLEDTAATNQDLVDAGVSPAAIEAVQLLTHRRDLSYTDYIIALKPNAVARAAKLLDLRDNYRLDRVAFREGSEAEDSERIQKYILTFRYLSDEIDEVAYRSRMELFHSPRVP